MSQYGEDLWIWENYPFKTTGFFVDVGAAGDADLSNTLLFENLGWKGILIDPRPINGRAGIFEQVAIAQGNRNFYFNGDFSGFMTLKGMIGPVNIDTLDHVCQKHGVSNIDILSIDTEGTELEVWDTLTVIEPRIVIIEYLTFGFLPKELEVLEYAARRGYAKIHKTTVNLILEKVG